MCFHERHERESVPEPLEPLKCPCGAKATQTTWACDMEPVPMCGDCAKDLRVRMLLNLANYSRMLKKHELANAYVERVKALTK